MAGTQPSPREQPGVRSRVHDLSGWPGLLHFAEGNRRALANLSIFADDEAHAMPGTEKCQPIKPVIGIHAALADRFNLACSHADRNRRGLQLKALRNQFGIDVNPSMPN
jgi:hypothetical protein